MQRVLVLGSGFSKAASEEMPLVREIALYFKNLTSFSDLQPLREAPYSHYLDNPQLFEHLLSLLNQEQPWLSPIEILQNRRLFQLISGHLGEYLTNQETLLLARGFPTWLVDLMGFLDKHHRESLISSSKKSIPVITFNYDTVVERALLKAYVDVVHEPILQIDSTLYRSLLQYLPALELAANLKLNTLRTARREYNGKSLNDHQKSFHLIKLHGSINWFYPGVHSPNQNIYNGLVTNQCTPRECYALYCDAATGMVPLIIPPILDKTAFYDHHLVRKLWSDARQYLEQADEILCVGYSLPLTDLTTVFLFQSLSRYPGKRIYIVNVSDHNSDITERYAQAFPKQQIDCRFLLPIAEKPIAKMVAYLQKS